MRRDAFTLIELLIVVGILAGIVGVSMLSLTDFRRESELRAVADRLEAIGALARAEALRHGEPVELILRETSDSRSGSAKPMRVLTRRLDPVASATRRGGAGEGGASEELGQAGDARARTELPKWLTLAPDEEEVQPVASTRGEPTDHRLAVFLSDGSALVPQSLTLEDGRSGARVTIAIEALTGECAASIDWNPEPIEHADDELEETDAGVVAPEREP